MFFSSLFSLILLFLVYRFWEFFVCVFHDVFNRSIFIPIPLDLSQIKSALMLNSKFLSAMLIFILLSYYALAHELNELARAAAEPS